MIMKGVTRIFLYSLFLKIHKAAIINIWHTDAIISTVSVNDLVLNISFGAGIANQIKFGSITIKNNSKPQISKLNLYFFNISSSSQNTDLPLRWPVLRFWSKPAKQKSCGYICSAADFHNKSIPWSGRTCHIDISPSALSLLFIGYYDQTITVPF